jgi:Tol biopolymer transport system component
VPIIGTGAPKQLSKTLDGVDADPAWSPDGSRIAFRRRVPNGTIDGNEDVFVMNADGSDARAIASAPAADFKPVWSPDNKNLLIISNRKSDAGRPGTTFDLWLVRVTDGKVVTQLGLKAKQITRPFWTLR